MTRIYNLGHSGEILSQDVLLALGTRVAEAAAQLGVTRAALSQMQRNECKYR